MGTWAKLPFSWLFGIKDEMPDNDSGSAAAPLPASDALKVCSDIALRFFSANLKSYVEEDLERFVIHGTSYMDVD